MYGRSIGVTSTRLFSTYHFVGGTCIATILRPGTLTMRGIPQTHIAVTYLIGPRVLTLFLTGGIRFFGCVHPIFPTIHGTMRAIFSTCKVPIVSIFAQFRRGAIGLPVISVGFFRAVGRGLGRVFYMPIVNGTRVATLPIVTTLTKTLRSSTRLVNFRVVTTTESRPGSRFKQGFLTRHETLVRFVKRFVVRTPGVLVMVGPAIICSVEVR